jgi:hypothetical protein
MNGKQAAAASHDFSVFSGLIKASRLATPKYVEADGGSLVPGAPGRERGVFL